MTFPKEKAPIYESNTSNNTLQLNSLNGDVPRYKSIDDPNIFTYKSGGNSQAGGKGELEKLVGSLASKRQ
jgi:hypothetical protein